MAGEMIGAYTGFKFLLDSTKALIEMNSRVERNTAVLALHKEIFAAQEVQNALTTKVRELEEQVRNFETWNAEKERYELKEMVPGFMARSVKDSMRGGGPAHLLCANCFEKRAKGHLRVRENQYHTEFKCDLCGVKHVHNTGTPQIRTGGTWGRGRT